MFRKISISVVFFLLIFLIPKITYASSNSFVNIVNPVRGRDFWDVKGQEPQDGLIGEKSILDSNNIPVTWLVRPDAFDNKEIIGPLKKVKSTDEIGLFLEITPTWTNKAGVTYQKSANWHSAGSIFLTGYSTADRKRLIDNAFEEFKKTFGLYPKSVGAWFVDAFSLQYMQQKYQILASLIVADQYSTDNYQIWGQFWQAPYYPQLKNTLVPAQTKEDKLPVVVMQWAARDPVNGYGKAVEESTYSVQVNDYIDYHGLDVNYFSKLVDIYTQQKNNKFNELVVGLENSYSWSKYKQEYSNQIQILFQKQKSGQFTITTMSNFAKWYQDSFPLVSPTQIVVAQDPLGTDNKTVWFMNPYYRVGWFFNREGSVIRDIRQYLESSMQLCYDIPCQNLNFATNATRVLDDVSFHQNWLIDEGKITVDKYGVNDQKFSITYLNEAQKKRIIEFLPRDISLDGVVSSIDGAILNATKNLQDVKINPKVIDVKLKTDILGLFLHGFLFIFFIAFVFVIPGFVLIKKFSNELTSIQKLFLSLVVGIVFYTLTSYAVGFIGIWLLTLVPILLLNIIYFSKKYFLKILSLKFTKEHFIYMLVLISGVVFQVLPTFKSGLIFSYGMGFWGPNTHDGLWHLALINQLMNSSPPVNPIFSNVTLKNYHYLFDLLVATTAVFTRISANNLLFRFFPILFSTFLGIGTIALAQKIFTPFFTDTKLKFPIIFSLFFVFFGGSFGWIVTFIHQGVLSGESSFWANQAISFNLNPPFALSLIVVLASIFLIEMGFGKKSYLLILVSSLLIGSLLGFKAYAGILSIGSLVFFATYHLVVQKKTNLAYFLVFSLLISLGIYLPNFSYTNTFVFSPFWFIHTMMDFPDRVGWIKLSAARQAYFDRGEWPKYLLVETLGLFLFIFGNLGFRVISFLTFIRIGKLKNNLILQYIFVFNLFAILATLLFIQVGTPWNTIQFFYYPIFFASLFSGFVLAWIYYHLPKIISFGLILVVLIIAPINSIATAKGYLYPYPHGFVSNEELEVLNFLKSKPDGVILTYPFDSKDKGKIQPPLPLFAYDSTAYVSALSGKSVYLEDEMQNDILGLDYKKRKVESVDFFNQRGKDMDSFLSQSKIRYIYLQKYYNLNLEESKNIRKIFDNKEVILYQVI